MAAIADGALGEMRDARARVREEEALHGLAARELLPENLRVHSEGRAGDDGLRPMCRRRSGEDGGESGHAFPAD